MSNFGYSQREITIAKLFLEWKADQVDCGRVKLRFCGICENFEEYVATKRPAITRWETMNFLDRVFMRWPKFSSYRRYPIPDPENLDTSRATDKAKEVYIRISQTSNGLWNENNPYNKLRYELVEFTATECENLLETGREKIMAVYNSNTPLPEGVTQEEVLSTFFGAIRKGLQEWKGDSEMGICSAIRNTFGTVPICRVLANACSLLELEIQELLNPRNYHDRLVGSSHFGYLSTAIATYITRLDYNKNPDSIDDWKKANKEQLLEFRLAIVDLLEEMCSCVDLDF